MPFCVVLAYTGFVVYPHLHFSQQAQSGHQENSRWAAHKLDQQCHLEIKAVLHRTRKAQVSISFSVREPWKAALNSRAENWPYSGPASRHALGHE